MNHFKNHSDNDLFSLMREGSEDALGEIYRRYWDVLLSVAKNRLKHQEEAEECVQNIFISLWQNRKETEIKFLLKTYLAGAVKFQVLNALANRARAEKRLFASVDYGMDLSTPSAETHLIAKELMVRLENTILMLPEKCRIVYQMSRDEGLSHQQIADELNLSPKTVNNQLTKALKNIKGSLTSLFLTLYIFLILAKGFF
ncbi:RNA polymerase sigma factor [Mucilaginibacter paludis]|uniref:RNA polymerase, sigma-24 subunit, ECF subfamily n=1 Tax=Mucilaginibacter paludis DSM 18603 TaxID=714943 RepID=H1YBV7_9SPHI|nr:RNA polymerase sigma-70 factor [Mucilaginibacter paludis]EHQ27035.1 RNA polymerase, sigma-24 subunit, ECF subfamily [Mucilaginibacter paludis DSM 18603]